MAIVYVKINRETIVKKYVNRSMRWIWINLAEEMKISPYLLYIKKCKKSGRNSVYEAKLVRISRIILCDYNIELANNGAYSIFYDERCVHYHIKPHVKAKGVYTNIRIEAIIVLMPWKYRFPINNFIIQVVRHKDKVRVDGRNELETIDMECCFNTIEGRDKIYRSKFHHIHLNFIPSIPLEYATKYIARITFRNVTNQNAAEWTFKTRNPPSIVLNHNILLRN